MIQIRHLLILSVVCISTAHAQEEFVMPRMQQNTYLSHAKDPQRFGFKTETTERGVFLIDPHAQLHANQTAEIRLSDRQIPVITLRGRSKRMKTTALLDTSSPTSWMEFGTSRKFATDFLGSKKYTIPYRGKYNTGDVPAYAAVVPSLRFDSVRMDDAPLYVRMAIHSLGPPARGITAPEIGTVVGYDLLKELEYIQFNSHAQTLKLSSTQPYTPNDALLMTAAKIVAVENQGLAIEGAVLGNPVPVVLDFAGDYHFSRGDVKVNITKQVSLGDVVFRKVPTLIVPTYNAPARAGRRMLENYIITICPKKGVVYFERFPE